MAIISGVSPQGISRGYLWGYLQQNIGVPPQGIFGGISDGVYPGVSLGSISGEGISGVSLAVSLRSISGGISGIYGGIFRCISGGVYPGVSPWGSLWVFPEGMLYYMHFRGNEII